MRLLKPLAKHVEVDLTANDGHDIMLNSACLGFKRSRLRMDGKIVSPMAGQVIAIVKEWRLLGFKAQNGKVYWWRLGLIWPTCPVVPFDLMVKVGDHVKAGQPLAIMVNAWDQPKLVVMIVGEKIRQALALIRTELADSLTLIHPVKRIICRTVISLAGNHQVKIIGPPTRTPIMPARVLVVGIGAQLSSG